MKFVIEHLEPELYEWCLIEYGHISKITGKDNAIFTNIGKKDEDKLKKFGVVFNESIAELKLNNICVLNQNSKKTLIADDKHKFEYFVFGGILGDSPAKKRTNFLTRELKNSNIKFEGRNLGNKQMPTDTAVYVANKILDGKKLDDFKFVDELEIEINDARTEFGTTYGGNESIVLPFRYAVDNNKLIINEKLVEYLRKRKGF